jgi:3-phosphoglycerate kinase
MLIKDQKKLEKFNKASALIQIGIDTAKAISALVAAANTNPLNGVTAGGAGIAQFASGVIQIATNIAKAKQLLTSPSTPVTAGGGDTGGGDTGSNTATMIPQAAQLFGSSNNANAMSAGGDSSGGSGNMMVTAVVSETQITNVQKKINMINKNSEL